MKEDSQKRTMFLRKYTLDLDTVSIVEAYNDCTLHQKKKIIKITES